MFAVAEIEREYRSESGFRLAPHLEWPLPEIIPNTVLETIDSYKPHGTLTVPIGELIASELRERLLRMR